MAFPLKSGADLYNQQLIRAAIWNHGADPSETVTGLFYFNTSNSSAGKKLRLYTGSAWKTLAFEEDLDVASNAEFKALEDKVKLLAGEVDTDAIISNMEDVENFLKGFDEDAKLMDVLNNKLDKSNNAYYGLDFNSTGTDGASRMVLKNNNNVLVGFGHNGTVAYLSNYLTSADIQIGDTITVKEKASANRYDILHSGNVGEYALKVDGSNKMSKGILFSDRTLTEALSTRGTGIEMFKLVDDSSVSPTGSLYFSVLNAVSSYSGLQLAVYGGAESTLYYRKIGDSGTWSAWKTIAFTDSNVASATKLETPRTIWGQRFDGSADISGHFYLPNNKSIYAENTDGAITQLLVLDSGNNLILGYGSSTSNYNTFVEGGNIYFRYGTSRATGLILNSSGNVVIGSSDLAGTDAKLYVDGDIVSKRYNLVNSESSACGLVPNSLITSNGDSRDIWLYNIQTLHIYSEREVSLSKTKVIDTLNVTGKTTISNDLDVSNNIVADGTIACKGIAAEGDAMDMVDKVVLHIVPIGNQQTFTLTHGLGTREITICIYEVTSLGTNMILTDVEIVDDNNISVSFGNPPTENHMVVVMG